MTIGWLPKMKEQNVNFFWCQVYKARQTPKGSALPQYCSNDPEITNNFQRHLYMR